MPKKKPPDQKVSLVCTEVRTPALLFFECRILWKWTKAISRSNMAYQSPLRLIFNICTGRAGSDDMCPTEGSTGKMVTRLSSLASREAKSCRIKIHRFQPVSRFVRPGIWGMKELEKEIRCSRRPRLNGEFGHEERDTKLR